MTSNSYLSLLALALAVSTVSPVRCAEPQQIEDQGRTSSAALTSDSRSRLRTRGGPGLAILGVGLTGALLLVALVNTFYHDGEQKPNANRPTQPTGPPPNNPTNTTQPTSPSQPNNPPRAFVGREERDLGRGFAVDTSTGSSEARSESNQDGRKSSSLDLLSHADLAKKLILFSRMIDKLD